MRFKRNTVVPFSRSYRRAPRWGMGIPPKRPAGWWQRMADPQFYLRAVIFISLLALVIIPLLADGTLAIMRPIAMGTDQCRVLHVVDGDTADIWCPSTGLEKARFSGFDAPELFSPKCVSELVAAQKSKWALRSILIGKSDLRMERGKLDRYARRLVFVWVGSEPLSNRMIAGGFARAYNGGARRDWCA